MLEEMYCYPMIFSYSEEGIDIKSIDIEECYTCAEDDISAIESAVDVLGLCLVSIIDDGGKLPEPTRNVNDIILEDNQKIFYISVWLPYARTKIKQVYCKKTLSIPVYLNILGEAKKVNFSAILAKGLKEELGIK